MMTENLELAKKLVKTKSRIATEICKVIVGQDEVIENLFSRLYKSKDNEEFLSKLGRELVK